MRKMLLTLLIVVVSLLFMAIVAWGVRKRVCTRLKEEIHEFKVTDKVPITPVQYQGKTRLCWAYGGVSLVESEMLHQGRTPADLSVMFVNYYNSLERAERAVCDDAVSWDMGGCVADFLYCMEHHGLMPASAMPRPQDDVWYAELRKELGDAKDGVVTCAKKTLRDDGSRNDVMEKINSAHNKYIGSPQDTFVYEGRTYTPKSFAEWVGVRADDFVQVTSMMDSPYYDWCVVKCPDHWRGVPSWNVPLDTLLAVVDYSLAQGHAVAWDGDIGEPGFRLHINHGFARLLGRHERWVSPKARQRAWDRGRTTDDHVMLICGTAVDEQGREYYVVKNSWGNCPPYGGMMFMSRAYFRYKTVMVTVRKESVPTKE